MLIRIHSNHAGEETRYRQACDTLHWPNMQGDIIDFVQQCSVCNRYAHEQQESMMPLRLDPLEICLSWTLHASSWWSLFPGMERPVIKLQQAGHRSYLVNVAGTMYCFSQIDLRPAETTLYQLLVNPEQPLVQSNTSHFYTSKWGRSEIFWKKITPSDRDNIKLQSRASTCTVPFSEKKMGPSLSERLC